MLKKRLRELLAFIQETDLQEVRWEKNGQLVAFQRAAPARTPAASAASASPTGAAAPAAPEPTYIRSTMVGTFYRSESADRPPFVLDGTVVKQGQPVAAIEAMKIMKDVLSTGDYKIVKALVQNGHAVEYGQPLFEVTPQADGESA